MRFSLPSRWRWSAVPSPRGWLCGQRQPSCQTHQCSRCPDRPAPRLHLPGSFLRSGDHASLLQSDRHQTNRDLLCTGLKTREGTGERAQMRLGRNGSGIQLVKDIQILISGCLDHKVVSTFMIILSSSKTWHKNPPPKKPQPFLGSSLVRPCHQKLIFYHLTPDGKKMPNWIKY